MNMTNRSNQLNHATDLVPEAEEMQRHATVAASLLKALANPNRLLILCLLGGEELTVGTLNARIPLSQSALSQHLAMLRTQGLVQTRRKSQTIYYRIAPGPAMDIIQVLYAHFCGVEQPQRRVKENDR